MNVVSVAPNLTSCNCTFIATVAADATVGVVRNSVGFGNDNLQLQTHVEMSEQTLPWSPFNIHAARVARSDHIPHPWRVPYHGKHMGNNCVAALRAGAGPCAKSPRHLCHPTRAAGKLCARCNNNALGQRTLWAIRVHTCACEHSGHTYGTPVTSARPGSEQHLATP